MTSLEAASPVDAELPSQQIARRIRGILAERQITGTAAAQALDLDQRAFSRRYRGIVAWSIDELSTLAMALNVPFEELVRHQGLEPRTRWFAASEAPLIAVEQLATVLPFPSPTARLLGGQRPLRPRPSTTVVRVS